MLLVTFVLSACNTGPENTQEDVVSDQNDTVISALDADTIITAVRMANDELCDTLSEKSSIESCHVKVADATILNKVDEKVDNNACDGIKEEKTLDQCLIMVKANQKAAEEKKADEKEMERVNEIVASGDASDCEKIEKENLKLQCEINTYMKLAADNNDPAPCKNIADQTIQDTCLLQITK